MNFYSEYADDFSSEIEEFGLRARNSNSRYAISKTTEFPINWSDNSDSSFGFMFSVRHEDLQSCGDAFLKLIGNRGHKHVKYHTHKPLDH